MTGTQAGPMQQAFDLVVPRLARVALAALLAAVIAGCGGTTGNEDQLSETEVWADDVCSSVGAWQDAIEGAAATLRDTANLSANDVRDAIHSVATATESLVTDLKGVGAPDTTAGAEAQQQLSRLSEQLADQQAVVEGALTGGSNTPDELLADVATVTGALSTMITDALTTVSNLRQLDGAEELEAAFENAPTCQSLRSSEGPSEN